MIRPGQSQQRCEKSHPIDVYVDARRTPTGRAGTGRTTSAPPPVLIGEITVFDDCRRDLVRKQCAR